MRSKAATRADPNPGRFWPRLASWVGVLAGVQVLYAVLAGFGKELVHFSIVGGALALTSRVLPFAAFAAAAGTRRHARALLLPLALVGSSVAFIDGWAAPILSYDPTADPGLEVELREMDAAGPATVRNLLRRRQYVLGHPPERYLASISQPTRHPPNWLAFLATMPFAGGLIVVLNGIFGAMVGRGLSENGALRRLHRIWLAGLAVFAGTMVVFTLAGAMARSTLAIPGSLAALAMTVVPLAGIVYARKFDPDYLPDDRDDVRANV